MRPKSWMVLLALVVMTLLLTQCAAPAPSAAPAQATPQTIIVTREVEKKVEVVVTQEVEKQVVVTQVVEKEVPAQPAAAKPSGTLRVGVSASPNSLDLPMGSERQAHNSSWPMYDSLVWLDDEGKVTPALAEKWDISADGKEYTFYLRQGVTFHNGEPFTADSVVASWQHGKKPGMHWSEKWTVAADVQKIDDHTVKVILEAPNVLLTRIMAQFWAMIPAKYLAEVGDEGFAQKPVGTGPFILQEWVKDDRIVYKANPNYWRPEMPKLETLIIRPIPESQTRVAAIQKREVDIVGRLTSEEAQSLLGVPGVKLIKYPVDRTFYIAFNNVSSGKGQPTEDAKVRLAMNYAVDREAIIKSLFSGYANLSTGLMTPKNLGYDPNLAPFPYDPEKAKALLTEAGYPNGFKMDFACPSGAYIHFEEVCQAIQEYLKKVGIETNLEIMESGRYWDLEGKKQLPPLIGDSWAETSGEAFPRLQGALAKDAGFAQWEDEKIFDLLKQISSTVDDTKRAALYTELQKYMMENPPFIFLYEPVTFEAVSDKVQDYSPRPAEEWYLMGTWVLQD